VSGQDQFLAGALMATYVVLGMYFMRFWRKTRDQLFLWFGTAFIVFAAERIVFAFGGSPNSESHAVFYVLRLFGYLMIIFGIVQKNRAND
jgi:hypothetical protein